MADKPDDPILTKDGTEHPAPHLQRWQFQPGKSGNPAGRAKGAKSFEQIIGQLLDEEVDAESSMTRRELVARVFLDEITTHRNPVLMRALLDRVYPTPQGDAAAAIAGHVKSWVDIVRERTQERELAEVVELERVK